MNKTIRNLFLSLSLLGASFAYAAQTPSLDVLVTDASGKVAYKGKTTSNGTFSTGKLAPGNYVVQFNTKGAAPSGQYMLVVSAGKKKVSADSIDGTRLTKGGVAMKLEGVAAGQSISGQVAGAAAANNPNVKIMNGKRYVWVKNVEAGSNIGGRWVEEGSKEAANATRMSTEGVSRIQEHQDVHQEGFGR